MKKIPGIVIDTNVFIAALRSDSGASYKLLSLVDRNKFVMNISVPLIFEYEDVAKRDNKIGISNEVIDDILDFICKVGNECKTFYLWRPFLKDPRDDFILELAIDSGSKYIITYNIKDFKNVEQFDIKVISPKEFLKIIGELS